MSDDEHTPVGQQQEEMPFAVVRGEPLSTPPKDLYIPPDALEVFLEAFEGPLDLLLYLIRRQNINILEIPIAEITAQYIKYIELMKEFKLELAAEYLVMAAVLAEIKSCMLLPRSEQHEDEEDPRAELVRRLQEYERFKKAAEDLNLLPRLERDIHVVHVQPPESQREIPQPRVDLAELLHTLRDVLKRADLFSSHHVQREPLSVRERMSMVLSKLNSDGFTEFAQMFDPTEGRAGVIVTLLAILELVRERLIDLVQSASFAQIYLKPVTSLAEV